MIRYTSVQCYNVFDDFVRIASRHLFMINIYALNLSGHYALQETLHVTMHKKRWQNIYLFILFIQYFKRVTHLAVIAILPCDPLCKHRH